MKQDERQVAPTLDGIRRDHRARYEFVAKQLPPGCKVIDYASGIGYGSKIMADAGHDVVGYDIDSEAIAYGRENYAHPSVTLWTGNGNCPAILGEFDVAVCFETIEHIKDPRPLLWALHSCAPVLYASVPNENIMPWRISRGVVTAFHFRHYTPSQFEELLNSCGWKVDLWNTQAGTESEVEPGTFGRTIIAVCSRIKDEKQVPLQASYAKHISIVGLGPSSSDYVDRCKRLGGRHAYCDETWVINSFGDVLSADMIFHMDDVRIQEIRAKDDPKSNIAAMLPWLKMTETPVMTSIAHQNYPGAIEFPLEKVINEFPCGYFNSTAAYAVAYAIYIGATKISLWGIDFTYPNAHDAEKGRACVEWWLGVAASRGIEIAIPKTSSLMDALSPMEKRFYGYDCVNMGIKRYDDGIIRVTLSEKSEMPTAEVIERNYSHQVHPNPLVHHWSDNIGATKEYDEGVIKCQ